MQWNQRVEKFVNDQGGRVAEVARTTQTDYKNLTRWLKAKAKKKPNSKAADIFERDWLIPFETNRQSQQLKKEPLPNKSTTTAREHISVFLQTAIESIKIIEKDRLLSDYGVNLADLWSLRGESPQEAECHELVKMICQRSGDGEKLRDLLIEYNGRVTKPK